MAGDKPQDLEKLASQLTSYTITPSNEIQLLQMRHRIAILAAWFGSYAAAAQQLHGASVIELGGGQGDMTAALGHVIAGSDGAGRLVAIDPAPLDYGAPYTLGDAQACLAKSVVGKVTKWVQQDPLDFLLAQDIRADYVTLVHSIFYLPSKAYFLDLLRNLRSRVAGSRSSSPKLLLAEWGMKHSTPAAEAHVLAVNAQIKRPRKDANVRTVLTPEELTQLAQEAGWRKESESWIEKPQLHDGSWEVAEARSLARGPEEEGQAEQRELIKQMEASIQQHGGKTDSMDVWTAVFVAA